MQMNFDDLLGDGERPQDEDNDSIAERDLTLQSNPDQPPADTEDDQSPTAERDLEQDNDTDSNDTYADLRPSKQECTGCEKRCSLSALFCGYCGARLLATHLPTSEKNEEYLRITEEAKDITSVRWRVTGARGPMSETASSRRMAITARKSAWRKNYDGVEARFDQCEQYRADMEEQGRDIAWARMQDQLASTPARKIPLPKAVRMRKYANNRYLVNNAPGGRNTERMLGSGTTIQMMVAAEAETALAGSDPMHNSIPEAESSHPQASSSTSTRPPNTMSWAPGRHRVTTSKPRRCI